MYTKPKEKPQVTRKLEMLVDLRELPDEPVNQPSYARCLRM